MNKHWDQDLWSNNGEGLTVGKLKEILADLPDDDEIIINCPTAFDDDGSVVDREARSVDSIDTYWHGAITFTEV